MQFCYRRFLCLRYLMEYMDWHGKEVGFALLVVRVCWLCLGFSKFFVKLLDSFPKHDVLGFIDFYLIFGTTLAVLFTLEVC